jgi:ParB family transcriptional regulator, chromosome partitioning protein
MNVTSVPFSQITAVDAINARAASKDGIEELAENIGAVGLIQPLAVRPADGGGYEVIDGRRRWQAMQRLVKAKTWKKDQLVPVLVRNEDNAGALELSMMANIVRLPMHPCDQHEVFARLAEQGRTPAEIGERFGMKPHTVRQRLALGRLAPEIRKAWRAEKIDEKTAQAFTIAAQHDVQIATFERLKSKRDLTEWGVRRELIGQRVAAARVPLPVVETYLSRGGAMTESLFEADRWLDDPALLKTILAEHIAADIERLKEKGWAWVADAATLPRQWQWQWQRLLRENDRQYTPEERERLAEIDKLYQDGDNPALDDESDAIDRAEFQRRCTPEIRAKSGVVISIGYDGSVDMAYGVIKPDGEDTGALPADEFDDDDVYDDDDMDAGESMPSVSEMVAPAEDEGLKVSQALAQTISEARTIAAAQVISQHPDLAMRLITAALTARFDSPVHVENNGHRVVQQNSGEIFAIRLPRILALPEGDAGREFAAAVASTLDLTDATWKFKGRDNGIRELIAALPADAYAAAARETFNPADYFSRASKAIALQAIGEMRDAGAGGLAPEDVLGAMKKAELAAAAAEVANREGWLPPELRHTAERTA